ncbi:hypothetical protein LINGRAHAP2_LOCUS8353 [Linum grandiflorum]
MGEEQNCLQNIAMEQICITRTPVQNYWGSYFCLCFGEECRCCFSSPSSSSLYKIRQLAKWVSMISPRTSYYSFCISFARLGILQEAKYHADAEACRHEPKKCLRRYVETFKGVENHLSEEYCDSCGRGGVEVAAPAAGSEERWATREDEQLEFYAANSCRSCFWDHWT